MDVKRKMRVQGVARLLVLGVAMRKRQLRRFHWLTAKPTLNTPFSFTSLRDVLPPTKSLFSSRHCPASSLEVPMDSTPPPTPRRWGFHDKSSDVSSLGSFCYCRHHLEILTRPSAVIKMKPDGPLSSTCTDGGRAGSC